MSSTGRWSRNIFSTSAGDGTSFAPSSQVNEGDANRGLLSTNGRASSFANSRNFELALLPQRSKTFPPVGPAAASYGRVIVLLDFALSVLLNFEGPNVLNPRCRELR